MWPKVNPLNCVCLDAWASKHSRSYWEKKPLLFSETTHTHTLYSARTLGIFALLGIDGRKSMIARQSGEVFVRSVCDRKDFSTLEGKCDHRILKSWQRTHFFLPCQTFDISEMNSSYIFAVTARPSHDCHVLAADLCFSVIWCHFPPCSSHCSYSVLILVLCSDLFSNT